MTTDSRQLPTAATGRFQLELLAQSPETGYVYWEWPDAPEAAGSATITVCARQGDGSWAEVESFEVTEQLGERFVAFARPGTAHRCRFDGPESTRRSDPVESPRIEAGGDIPQFVRVSVTDDGLAVHPVDYDHPVHGSFPRGGDSAPSSWQ